MELALVYEGQDPPPRAQNMYRHYQRGGKGKIRTRRLLRRLVPPGGGLWIRLRALLCLWLGSRFGDVVTSDGCVHRDGDEGHMGRRTTRTELRSPFRRPRLIQIADPLFPIRIHTRTHTRTDADADGAKGERKEEGEEGG